MELAKHLLIVGAGFSRNAGLPLAGNFAENLLDVEELKKDGPSQKMAEFLREFVAHTFGNGKNVDPADWPPLEDIFTLVDLSANTGHHLGPNYAASRLRTVRRALIVRTVRMLRQAYRRKLEHPDQAFQNLRKIVQRLNFDEVAILSMNWDTVIESEIGTTQKVSNVDYGCGAIAASFQEDELVLRRIRQGQRTVRLVKPHGSTNWLYCDACREVFWVPVSQQEDVARTLFHKSDWNVLGVTAAPATRDPECPACHARALGTRLATFSYRKALDFPMHATSWRTAERLLKAADTWTFVGYSMPPADFEFKHLLKRVQMSKGAKPHIAVVTGGTAATETLRTYQTYLGSDIWESSSGIDNRVLRKFEQLGLIDSLK